jgi:hypothetical protein
MARPLPPRPRPLLSEGARPRRRRPPQRSSLDAHGLCGCFLDLQHHLL